MEFKNAVFAGGGSRCMWQLGFWDGANAAGLGLSETVDFAASTSAGCAMATAALLNRAGEALELFKELTSQNPRNIYWRNLRPGSGEPLLPHQNMYRWALKRFLTPHDLQLLAGKRLAFLMARYPRYLPSGIGAAIAFSVYGFEKRVKDVLHPTWTQLLGFEPIVRGNQEASDINDLINIILACSCVPPVLPSPGYKGMRVLDGGVIDNVPAHLAEDREGATLVLLSKQYKQPLPVTSRRIYVQPSKPILMDKFDYANPEGVQAAYDLGLADGLNFSGLIRSSSGPRKPARETSGIL